MKPFQSQCLGISLRALFQRLVDVNITATLSAASPFLLRFDCILSLNVEPLYIYECDSASFVTVRQRQFSKL